LKGANAFIADLLSFLCLTSLALLFVQHIEKRDRIRAERAANGASPAVSRQTSMTKKPAAQRAEEKAKVTGSYAIKTIRNAWNTSRSSFEISVRANELRYNAGATWEAGHILKELPETLEAHKSRDWVVMNLDEAKQFFGVSFKKSWLDRFQKR
jgi:hypothetical protein